MIVDSSALEAFSMPLMKAHTSDRSFATQGHPCEFVNSLAEQLDMYLPVLEEELEEAENDVSSLVLPETRAKLNYSSRK